ncbi:conserved hypothetical protein [Coccidioides posadasii str. Silveira]|uniref:Uncharacterized protein n=1 Tax=Coccidioides posadasii (strain RMSCC 757 / Silveira) TaxID=443226 RepID=E9D8R2_COCPS|nr:conserved hypothetical protein [Coccidioides posadasii str. Silveira]
MPSRLGVPVERRQPAAVKQAGRQGGRQADRQAGKRAGRISHARNSSRTIRRPAQSYSLERRWMGPSEPEYPSLFPESGSRPPQICMTELGFTGSGVGVQLRNLILEYGAKSDPSFFFFFFFFFFGVTDGEDIWTEQTIFIIS